MTNIIYLLLILLFVFFIKKTLLFSYVPKKSKGIYSCKFAHRGLHLATIGENTKRAIIYALSFHYDVEVDIRLTKDGKLVVFHDRYSKVKLGFPGRISKTNSNKLLNANLRGTKDHVPLLSEIFEITEKKCTILIEVKGLLTKRYKKELLKIMENYTGCYYFHTKNLYNYFWLKYYYNTKDEKKVYWVLNIFRKRFDFLKKHDLKVIEKTIFEKKYIDEFDKLVYNISDNDFDNALKLFFYKFRENFGIPSVDDFLYELENMAGAKDIIKLAYKVINRYGSRIDTNHWLFNNTVYTSKDGKKYNISATHRCIYDNKYPENSKEGILECVKNGFALEVDIIYHKHDLYVYHDDRISLILGQEKSSARKTTLMRFEEVLELVDGKVPIICDIKDYNLFSRKLEKILIFYIKKYPNIKYAVQSFNPLVMMFFYRRFPRRKNKKETLPADMVFGQVGHSLKGLKEKIKLPVVFKQISIIVNFCLFYWGKPDYVVYDLNESVTSLTNFNNIIGIPVIGYAPKTEEECRKYYYSFDGFIGENYIDKQSWDGTFIKKTV